jgi:hypothetical protein
MIATGSSSEQQILTTELTLFIVATYTHPCIFIYPIWSNYQAAGILVTKDIFAKPALE